jgi:hypothetical protein
VNLGLDDDFAANFAGDLFRFLRRPGNFALGMGTP